jgi:hypothetical protein
MNQDCPICCESEKIIKCQNQECLSKACINCWKKWHTRDSMKTYEPICMEKCGFVWSDQYMIENFRYDEHYYFTKVYENYRIKVYNDEFEATLPEYIKRYEASKRLKKIVNKQIKINNMAYDLYCTIISNQYYRFNFYKPGFDEDPSHGEHHLIVNDPRPYVLSKTFNKLNIISQHLRTFISEEISEEIMLELINKKCNSKINLKINGYCPNNECSGMLVGKWECDICKTKLCQTCNMLKDKHHKCRIEDIQTFKKIKKDSKPCPKCQVPVYKISGCNDMYCTQCKTFFCWSSLKIITRYRPHNPHAAAMRENIYINEDPITFNPCNLDMFNWGILQDCFLGYSTKIRESITQRTFRRRYDGYDAQGNNRYNYVNIAINSEPIDTDFGKRLKVLYHIIRELDAIVIEYEHNVIDLEKIFKNDVAKKYIVKKIDKKHRGFLLWDYKKQQKFDDDVNLVRRAWIDSSKIIIANYIKPEKGIKKTKGFSIKDFEHQIKVISEIANQSLSDIFKKYRSKKGKLVSLFPKDHDRFRYSIILSDKFTENPESYVAKVLRNYEIIYEKT